MEVPAFEPPWRVWDCFLPKWAMIQGENQPKGTRRRLHSSMDPVLFTEFKQAAVSLQQDRLSADATCQMLYSSVQSGEQ